MFILVRDDQVFLIKIMTIIRHRKRVKSVFQVLEKLRKKHLSKVVAGSENAGLMPKADEFTNGIHNTVNLKNTERAMVSI